MDYQNIFTDAAQTNFSNVNTVYIYDWSAIFNVLSAYRATFSLAYNDKFLVSKIEPQKLQNI